MEKKNESGTLLPMTVTEGLTVNIIPNSNHQFLMTTKEVANGYGVTEYAIRKNKLSLSEELTEGKHFVTAVTIGNGELPGALRCAHNAVLWTRRGIVRMGFSMRSERAKLFRDWAEELVIEKMQRTAPVQPLRATALPKPRNHNRLTSERLLSIMADVARIDDHDIRISIANKLMIGGI